MNLKVPLRRVIIESPYAAAGTRTLQDNIWYLSQCIRDSILLHGEAPFASHQMYTSSLQDEVPDERTLGIACGYAWWPSADFVAFYLDHGLSRGMELALAKCRRESIVHCFRSLYGAAQLEAQVAQLPDMASSLALAVQALEQGEV